MRISGLLMSYLWGEKHLKSFTIQMISSAKASFLQNNLEFSIDSNLVMMPIYRSLPVFQDGGRTRSTHRRYSTILWKNFQPVSALIEVKNFISKGSKISAKIVLKMGQLSRHVGTIFAEGNLLAEYYWSRSSQLRSDIKTPAATLF